MKRTNKPLSNMASITPFEFDGNEIRFVNDKPVANDVAKALGYKDPADAVYRIVKPKNKGVGRIQTPGGTQNVKVLELEGVLELISTSRLPRAVELAALMGIMTLNSLPEQETVRVLEEAFLDLKPVRQFQVHGYRIDLYLTAVNIAIECDEYGHLAYSTKKEKKRAKLIKSALGCSFVRFNPHEPNFNIGTVIRKVRELI